VASSEETARLKSVLATNPEAQRLFEEMQALANAMSEVQHVDPPPTLKPAIMRSLEASNSQRIRATGRVSILQSLKGSFLWNPGYAFAGGLAVGLLLLFLTSNLLTRQPIGDSELTGTLVLHGQVPGFTPGEAIEINRGNVKGTVETQLGSGICLVRLQIEAPEGVTVSIRTDPARVHLDAIRPSSEPGARLTVHEGELTLVGATGGSFVALFGGNGQSIPPAQIRIISSEKLILDGVIALERKN
jgi:hypothetical protein